MGTTTIRTGVLAAAIAALAGCAGTMPVAPGPQNMTFFVTSKGPGKGADLGGLAGADAHCAALAKAAGAPADRVWRAYLSTQAPALNDPNFVNARDRIGAGPWHNAKGELIATSVADLHSPESKLSKATAIDEAGKPVNGRTDKPNQHDMLTGSRPDGTAFPGAPFADMTCGNWTKSGKDGSAMRRPPRPRRAGRQRVGQVVELGASLARLRPRGARQHRRRGALLLLRGEVGRAGPRRKACLAPVVVRRRHVP